MRPRFPRIPLLLILLLFTIPVGAQSSFQEEVRLLKTYPFHDPNPIPILVDNPKIYPYHTFNGYTHEAEMKEWKIVTPENPFIKVWVLPEVGGKVWGAIEKQSGEEFIYRNEVMKFRNIAMRGPWTSGGIEFNFGIIGHSPSTATPVDYITRKNDDGSVSCIVGNLDLSSRTRWTVEIRLPPDKGYFETLSQWHNPTPIDQSYYNWMTGAAVARKDLRFITPGDRYLTHPGKVNPWPIDDEGRDLSIYSENDFGPHKSYHVVGYFEDFFGGYYDELDVGFGHWAPYEEMPGRKLWLWSQSRNGGIWEDLLTDTDGQYIEFQAGRLFNQYSPSEDQNPLKQAGFPPLSADLWREIWFPVREIGGMADANPNGVLNVEFSGDTLSVSVMSLGDIRDLVIINVNGERFSQYSLALPPMHISEKKFSIESPTVTDIEVIVGDRLLYYHSNPESIRIQRPFEQKVTLSEPEQLLIEANEAWEYRSYREAFVKFQELEKLPGFLIPSSIGLAKCYYRQQQMDTALQYISKVLQVDTYHPEANYLAGLCYRSNNDMINALESFGWAARDMRYRSAAYTQMAEVYFIRNRYDQAKTYVAKSLNFNQLNINALELSVILARKENNREHAEQAINRLEQIDPLHHLSRFEKYQWEKDDVSWENFVSPIQNELKEETFLELSIRYYSLGLRDEALQLLWAAPNTVKNQLWQAYLLATSDPEKSVAILARAMEAYPEFVFPYRKESIPMLQWAEAQLPSWKFNYYLGLNYYALDDRERALDHFRAAGDQPDFWPFYITRAELFDVQNEKDLLRAFDLSPNWRTARYLFDHYFNINEYQKAVEIAERAYQEDPDNDDIGLKYVRGLLANDRTDEAIAILDELQILPFENASEGRTLYELAYLSRAIDQAKKGNYSDCLESVNRSLQWPERLGVGEPYIFDRRKQHTLMAHCYGKLEQSPKALDLWKQVADDRGSGIGELLSLVALQKLDEQQLPEKWNEEVPQTQTQRDIRDMLMGKEVDPGDRRVFDNRAMFQTMDIFDLVK